MNVDLATFSDNIGWIVAITGGLVTLGVLSRKCLRKIRRAVKKGNDVIDTLVGREAIYHPESGKELEPASPGIGARMVNQEEQMLLLTNAVSKIADSHVRLEHVESRVDAHDEAIKELKAAQIERVITRAESAQAWQAMEAAINADPNEHHETEL